MDLIILGGLFLILSGFAFWSLKRNEKKERQQLFDEINPIMGKPLISTESHNIQQNDTMKSTEPVTASVIVQQSMSKVLKKDLTKIDVFIIPVVALKTIKKDMTDTIKSIKKQAD